MAHENIDRSLAEHYPPDPFELDKGAAQKLGGLIARIIDYKSAFTRRHTQGIAQKALIMAGYYHMAGTEKEEFYLAACFHDIGKLSIPAAVLEKEGVLTDEEFEIIKSHVYQTWLLLKDIEGFENVCRWASEHHEKLNGRGYPFGKKAADLDRNSRLLACIDIYQAVSEHRPYHAGRSHGETIGIMRGMAEGGFIDGAIVEDMDKVLK
jgi:HD-GYP domain-containing protein (c-di-GMP phosphodiesterase class II)